MQSKNFKDKVIGIIPARYGSTRLPGKLLKIILDKPIIQHTYESSKKSKRLDDIIIATDSEEIQNFAKRFQAPSVMTSIECINGTYRIIDAMKRYPNLLDADIIVNIQGDHPFISSKTIDACIDVLQKDKNAMISTPVCKIEDVKDYLSPHVVKCVFNKDYNALYFSRSPIPYSKNFKTAYQHIGIYAYRVKFLKEFAKLKFSFLQTCEDLEQLSFLENGYTIKIAITDKICLSVDVESDLEKVKNYICQK
jgi:3-deoxy-manno-octulosonate cytidylyltransferase (CMP-KDO synthetase)